MNHYKIYYYFAFLIFNFTIIAAPLTNLPVIIKQPDGKVIHCFTSGDEFHNWIHDKDNYTFIQDQKTGYWTYAVKVNNVISASNYIVGQDDPKSLNLLKGINLSPEEILQKRNNILKARFSKRSNSLQNLAPENTLAPSKGIVNNLAIFVRFSDDPEFTEDISYYEKLFNTGEGSVRNYFLEDSYGKLTINTIFYPKSDNKTLSYKDIFPRGYYVSYNEVTNPDGYKDGYECDSRENELLKSILNSIKDQIPENVDFDADKDGRIDNICFIIYGTSPGYNQLLWPHYGRIWDTLKINNKNVNGYAFLMNVPNTSLEYIFNTSCHELGHSIGFPDLYRYNNPGEPVGRWDMMSRNVGHSGAWMKYKYARWIDSIPEIIKEGFYTINDITKPSNNCYKIKSSKPTDEFFVVEFRKKEGAFEKDIPGSGLLVSRINPGIDGNLSGPSDEVYYYRPKKEGYPYGDIMNAFFSAESERAELNYKTNPSFIFSDTDDSRIKISNIGSSSESKISFYVKRKNAISAQANNTIASANAGNFGINVKYVIPENNNKWGAEIDSGSSWMRITSGNTGINDGQINVSFDENTTGGIRTGLVTVSDSESYNNPINILFTQYSVKETKETEPNNSVLFANPIKNNSLISGTVNLNNDYSDYYRFYATAGDTIEIQYFENNNPIQTYLNLLDNYNHNIVTSNRNKNGIRIYSTIILNSGYYYIVVGGNPNYLPVNYFFYLKNSNINSEFVSSAPKISAFSTKWIEFNSIFFEMQITTFSLPTTLKIEYGTTKNYGKTYTLPGSPYNGLIINDYNISIIERISDLEPETKYHFRLIAENSKGTTYSNDCEVTTGSKYSYIYEIEPNQTSTQATQITIGDSVCASINPSTDIDYYKFYAAAGDIIEMRLNDSTNLYKNTVYLWSDNTFPIGHGSNYNGLLKMTYEITIAGIYYISVQSTSDKNYTFNYSLVLQKYKCIAPKISTFFVSGRSVNSVLAEIKISTSVLPTTLKIDYGFTTNYGKTYTFNNTAYQGLAISNFEVSIYEKISGLLPDTKYHFRLSAQNKMGTVLSNDCEATTNSNISFISEVEPNQTKSEATQIFIGDSICASISSSSDVDYYKFYASTGDMVTILLNDNSNANKGSLYFMLNQQFPYSGNVNNGIILIKNTIQTSGIYYIYVQNKSGNNSPFNYSLVLDKFQYSAPKYFSINFYLIDNIAETNYNSIRIYPSISTNGLPTTIKIEYGTTQNYGNIYSYTSLIPNSNFYNDFLVFVRMVVPGLEPNTTYHFRVIVENDLGKDFSKDYRVSTLPKPLGYELLPYNDSLISLNCLALVDQNTLIANSNAYPTNSIFRSSDQGKSWKRCDNNISANSISTFDGINIMAGSSQYIYKSTDGGNNWSIVINKSSTSFSSIFSIDKKITYASGYSYSTSPNTYFITKTIDGGVTWNTLISSTIIQLNKILFINENNGFALGNKGLLIKTKDGGLNWIEQKTDTTYNFKNIFFIDNNYGFIVGDFYRITSYTDFTGKIINTNNYSSLILKTTDGGNTWERQNITTKKTLSFIIFTDKNNGIIVGYEGIILKTTNGGNSWIEQPSGTTANFIGACFIDPSTVIIASYEGTIIKGNFNSDPNIELTDFKLSNNYPNPFNSQTNVEYSIPEDGLVKIKIYDILGREIETILNENQKSGKYGISWKPKNISTGIYYYRIEAGKHKETKKLLYLK